MKCSKKVFAATVAAAMIATMGASTVFASDATGEISGTSSANTTRETTVKYSVTEGYTWSIHSEINFGENKGANSNKVIDNGTNTVSVTKNVIPTNKKLRITVEGSGTDKAFVIKNKDNVELSYAISENSNTIKAKGTVMDVAAGTNTDSKNLTFTLTTGSGTAEVAGDYTGTVTYTASVVDASAE